MRKKRQDINKIFYHEDMYLQIEVLPIENKRFCLKQMDSISEFAEEHKEGLGYSSVYLREEEEYKLTNKKIPLKSVVGTLEKYLNNYDEVYTCYGGHECKSKNTIAFGFKTIQIFITFQKDFIKYIWMNGYTREMDEIQRFSQALIAIGKELDLLIADWEAGTITELKNAKAVKKYINKFYL